MRYLKVSFLLLFLAIFAIGDSSTSTGLAFQVTAVETTSLAQDTLFFFIPQFTSGSKPKTLNELMNVLQSIKIELTQNDLLGKGDNSWYSATINGPDNPPFPNFSLEIRLIAEEITDVIVIYNSTGNDFDSETWKQINPAKLLMMYGNPNNIYVKYQDGIFTTVYILWETQRVAVAYHWRLPKVDNNQILFCFTPNLYAFVALTVPEGLSITQHAFAAVKDRDDLRAYSPEARPLQSGMFEGISTIDGFTATVRAGKCLQSPLSFWRN
jgi:hypothetical protein